MIPDSAIFFPRINDNHCDRIHCSLTTVCCFDSGYVGKQPVAWKEYCAEYWLKELQKSMDRCTGHNISEILLKICVIIIVQSIYFSMTVISDLSRLKALSLIGCVVV